MICHLSNLIFLDSYFTFNSISSIISKASHFGHVAAVQLLVKSKASADFANHKGTTALMRASQEGHLDISDILLSAGADVNRKNHEGMNALMLASQRGHGAMVLLLIKSAAAMDEQTAQGSTALMLACKRGHEKCVEVLVAMGAEIFIRDIRSRTACDTATKRGYTDLLAILNTQLQVRRTQEYRHAQRTIQLLDMRALHQDGRLRLSSSERNVQRLTHAVKMTLQTNESILRADDFEEMTDNPSCCSADLTAMDISGTVTVLNQSVHNGNRPPYVSSNAISMTLQEAQVIVSKPENISAVQIIRSFLTSSSSSPSISSDILPSSHPFTNITPPSSSCNDDIHLNKSNGNNLLSQVRPGYALWQWPLLLQRYFHCFLS